MIIRALTLEDYPQIRDIHEKFYGEEFSLQDFYSGFLAAFAIIDGDRIITAGGIRSIAEAVAITDKSVSVRKRREALYNLFQANTWACKNAGYDQMHIFIQNETWMKQLAKTGFKMCKGKALFIGT